MAWVMCPKNHKYDDSKHSDCPYCTQLDQSLLEEGLLDIAEPKKDQPSGTIPDPGLSDEIKIDAGLPRALETPVVAWLVIVEGPSKHQDYPIRMGRNLIGTSSICDIILDAGGDFRFATPSRPPKQGTGTVLITKSKPENKDKKENERVSAIIRASKQGYEIIDCFSKDGIGINGELCVHKELQDNDKVEITKIRFIFKCLTLSVLPDEG